MCIRDRVEAVRKAQEKYGEGKAMTGEQVRWGLENLDITDARLKEIGATNLLPEIKTSCDNHEGSGKVKIQQWDGEKWVVAVSYTHLDVYKRQAKGAAGADHRRLHLGACLLYTSRCV